MYVSQVRKLGPGRVWTACGADWHKTQEQGGGELAVRTLVILALLAALVWFGSVIVRLENYRYGNSLGMCAEDGGASVPELVARDRCLNEARTRTNPLWHLGYALGVL